MLVFIHLARNYGYHDFFWPHILVEEGYLGPRWSSKILECKRDFLIKFRCYVSVSRGENYTTKNTCGFKYSELLFMCLENKLGKNFHSPHRKHFSFAFIFYLFIFHSMTQESFDLCVQMPRMRVGNGKFVTLKIECLYYLSCRHQNSWWCNTCFS